MAITYTETAALILGGNNMLSAGYLTHDGSSTTIVLPCGTIDYAQIGYGMGTADTGTTVSWSGSTLTLSLAGTSGRTHYLLWIGSA